MESVSSPGTLLCISKCGKIKSSVLPLKNTQLFKIERSGSNRGLGFALYSNNFLASKINVSSMNSCKVSRSFSSIGRSYYKLTTLAYMYVYFYTSA